MPSAPAGPNPSLRVPFGLREGHLYEPMQVARGARCECICPGCGKPLWAKHSPSGKRVAHFAHAAGVAPCANGYESALHLAAKQLLAQCRAIALPEHALAVRVPVEGGFAVELGATLVPAGRYRLENLALERAIGAVRPDVMGEMRVGNKAQAVPLAVEIAVTHFLDEDKIALMRALGLAVVEVNLGGLGDVGFAEVKQILLGRTDRTHWHAHPHADATHALLTARAQAEAEARRARLRQQQLEAVAQYRARTPEQNYEWAMGRVPHSQIDRAACVDRGVPHEDAFGVPRRVWQALVYAVFVRPAHDGVEQPEPAIIARWLTDVFGGSGAAAAKRAAVKAYLGRLAGAGELQLERNGVYLRPGASPVSREVTRRPSEAPVQPAAADQSLRRPAEPVRLVSWRTGKAAGAVDTRAAQAWCVRRPAAATLLVSALADLDAGGQLRLVPPRSMAGLLAPRFDLAVDDVLDLLVTAGYAEQLVLSRA